MFTWLTSFYNTHINRRLFPPVEEAHIRAVDLHRTKMDRAGQEVMDADAPLSARVEAVKCLGILTYTASSNDASAAARFIPAVAHLLYIRELTDDQAIVIVQGLSSICYGNIRNIRAAHDAGLDDILQVLLTPVNPLSTKTKLWSCYLLNILCYKSIAMIDPQANPSLRVSLEALEADDWFCWPKNYARELLCLLGFWPPQTVTADSKRAKPKPAINEQNEALTE